MTDVSQQRFTLIEVAGSAYQMGFQHGSKYRDLVWRSLAAYERILAAQPNPARLSDATALAMESLSDAEAFAPELVEEVRGIAAGAGLTFEDVFSLNASLDVLIALASRPHAQHPLACSTYAMAPPATADGQVYVGWNADDKEWWLPLCVLIQGSPADSEPFLTWTFAGFVGRPGMNRHLALGANGLFPFDSGRGVPYPFLCRKVLAQRTVPDAINVISTPRRLSGMNYMIGDTEGNIASLEVSGTKTAVIDPQNGWIAHTNHYIADTVQVLECLPRDSSQYANTSSRLMRWKEMIGEKTGKITLNDLQAMHRDHANAPDSICRHAVNEGFGITLTSLICAPRQQRMWVAYGTPCENEFLEYAV